MKAKVLFTFTHPFAKVIKMLSKTAKTTTYLCQIVKNYYYLTVLQR